MRVLLTGASGFLGRYLAQRFREEELTTLGLMPCDLLRWDLAAAVPMLSAFDLVVHAAGKAHSMPRTIEEERAFFEVNATGTANLLAGLERKAPPAAFVFISTVAVYGRTRGVAIDEREPLLAQDAYGASKREAEALVVEWCARHGVRAAVLRLPLVAGPNPPGNLGAMIRGVRFGYYFNVAGGRAAKSVVLAGDVASIIPRAADVGGVYNLTDGEHPTFLQLSSVISQQLGKRVPLNLPYRLAACLAAVGDFIGPHAPFSSVTLGTVTSDLTFDDTHARERLDWCPTRVLQGLKISEP